MIHKRKLFAGFAAILVVQSFAGKVFSATPTAKPVLIGLDAEFEYQGSTSAEAIRHGIQIAIDEINKAGGVLQGRPLKLMEKANRSLPARSANNIKEFAATPDLVAVFCGRFSPTVLEMLPLIHQLGLPLMNPWSAADGIIDHSFSPNYVFRLSMKDSWAANAMLANLSSRNLKNVGLLMLNTSWGRSTVSAAQKYQKGKSKVNLIGTQWINWDDDEASMLNKVKQLRDAGAQALLLTANAGEAATLVKGMLKLPAAERLPVVSHWGVTGGKLPDMVGPDFYKLDFRVVQTYTFIGQKSLKAATVISAHNARDGGTSARSILSPVGVAHAYDLTHILARAIQLAGSTDRAKIRDALEKVRNYDGLIKKYAAPFTVKRHEALSESDVFLARYSPLDGALEKLP
ncbi:ABC transporter substrate-binding protein [Hydrogenophaga sp. PBL-H3]|uniref:ABC transporter substrate-binding protein n=1 Tax=Hydrogenophaga sp. PBL-H3 TaxID=434010 RepID=UPI00131F71C1|nr:ABC transporter substrate-binding protein [Hydrogenophaga sp. PBL-H3]QHE74578.1 ABC transporter substrate-binding protein [Hydrogenophaga sp. PBL-H3]QHE79003.1 ABC transporter substrate-binding protein [Hydrogenophaga sp. PBL-H3]